MSSSRYVTMPPARHVHPGPAILLQPIGASRIRLPPDELGKNAVEQEIRKIGETAV
jgi:hypothetical protein